MADELNCTFLYDGDGFARPSPAHGSFKKAEEYLNIGRDWARFEETKDRFSETIILDRWPWPAPAERKCNTLYRAKHTQICRYGANRYETWCTHSVDFDDVKWRLRERFFRTPRRTAFPKRHSSVSVAWHLRTGDITPDQFSNSTFLSLFQTVLDISTMHGMKLDLHFVRSFAGIGDEFSFIDNDICKRVSCKHHIDSEIDQSLTILLSADILITSRSSFAYVAAIYSNNIILMETPKENCGRCYNLGESFRFNAAGRILKPKEFEARFALFSRRRRP